MLKYPLDWKSSLEQNNSNLLNKLSNRMAEYYRTRAEYYTDISNSEDLWVDKNYIPYQAIQDIAHHKSSILEIGCGKSAILRHFPALEQNYTGTDFSKQLISENISSYPKAKFKAIENPSEYPFEDHSFDFIFSVFVLEHTVFPAVFLEECIRLLKPGGVLLILAPNYLDHNWMASQQVNPDLITGRELLKKGKLNKAARAFIYNKVLIPLKCRSIRKNLPAFVINANPICFEVNEFKPDVDAVYVVSEKEVRLYLSQQGMKVCVNNLQMKIFAIEHRLCFVKATKP